MHDKGKNKGQIKVNRYSLRGSTPLTAAGQGRNTVVLGGEPGQHIHASKVAKHPPSGGRCSVNYCSIAREGIQLFMVGKVFSYLLLCGEGIQLSMALWGRYSVIYCSVGKVFRYLLL